MARHDEDDITIHGLQGHSRNEEEILGALELLGLTTSSPAIKGSTAFQTALAQRMAARAPITKHVPPTKKRRWPVGFIGSGGPASGTVNIQVQPQCLFRGEKLICSESTPGGSAIVGIFVGNLPQLPTLQNTIATSAFASGALDNEMLFDTCGPAMFITFQVQFSSSCTFTAALWGHAVQ